MYEHTLRELIDLLNAATKAYDAGSPTMSDEEWDQLYFQLKQREKLDGIIYPDSPTQKIYFEKVSALQKTIHQDKPMLSLDKTKDPNDIQSFVNGHDWLGMFKLDGLSCRLTYVNGELAKGETRGDGIIGEDITHNIKVVKNIPKVLTNNIEEVVIIDGEIICDYENFKLFEDEYKNPRNFAAGSIRLLDAKECARRNLSFIAWDLIKGIDEDFFAWRLEKLNEWGFNTVPRVCDAETIDDALNILHDMRASLPYGSYPIDGYVFRYESQKEYDEAGKTDHHFKGAYALKEYDEEYETTLKYIDYDVSRNGILTPVAVFEPINIDGTMVERCSLFNLSILEKKLGQPYEGQKIWICKRNQIIPYVSKAEKHTYGELIKNNLLITTFTPEEVICPICGSYTKIITSNTGVETLYCPNEQCEGKLVQQIDHYCGKKGLDIKGLSRKTIEKLIDYGYINNIKDIYGLEKFKTDWESKPGFGKASVEKILNAINAEGRHPQLNSFISALGIPLVGQRVAKDIVKYYSTWNDFREAIGKDWTQFKGFGPELNDALNNFNYTEADEIVKFLTFSNKQEDDKKTNEKIKDLIFVITGKLSRKRDDIKVDIEKCGGKVTNSISSKTNYLVCNDKNSITKKSKEAKKLNIPIITEEELIKMIK